MKKKIADEELLESLESVVRNLAYEVRYEKGNFRGGFCRIDDQQVFIINKELSTTDKIKVFTQELASIDLEGVYILPVIREMIESEKLAENE